MVPSMFIQILVENAIKHGLKNKEGHKQLNVSVQHNDNGTDICVEDNGIGFDIRRSNSSSTKTGLDIIRTSIMIINRHNKHNKIKFQIHNIITDDGRIEGCESMLHIPMEIKYTKL